MARFPLISELQQNADAVSAITPMSIQSNQGRDFLDPFAAGFVAQNLNARHMLTVQAGAVNPVRSMRRGYQAAVSAQAADKIMTTMLQGVRQSGSMARTVRLSGLGAVDCASIPEGTWSGAQADVFMSAVLSTVGTPDTAQVESIPAFRCYTAWLNAHIVSDPVVLAQAVSVVAAVQAAGGFQGIDPKNTSVLAGIGSMVHAHGLTPKRAVQLYNCGLGVTKAGGWADYANSWAETSCMQRWYENPWYLGTGAAVLIGAVWFATKKKRS